jgi:hypothetical protein
MQVTKFFRVDGSATYVGDDVVRGGVELSNMCDARTVVPLTERTPRIQYDFDRVRVTVELLPKPKSEG